ncbi:hypothetical protein [Salinicola halophilus]|uniref:hypothetical protein n=1 Tax=Salinicola halophilus TaxID=184065 RepID=UPI000DA242BB|nr:hypothetical protein [Salinicola halophilus]
MADESFWAGFLANGAGAAIGAVVGGVLAYLGASAVSRQQTRQAKLEEALTLNRSLAKEAKEVLRSAEQLAKYGETGPASERTDIARIESVVEKADSLYTLMEVHKPDLVQDAKILSAKVSHANFLCWALRGLPAIGMEPKISSQQFADLQNDIRESSKKLHGRLIRESSTVSPRSRSKTKSRYR